MGMAHPWQYGDGTGARLTNFGKFAILCRLGEHAEAPFGDIDLRMRSVEKEIVGGVVHRVPDDLRKTLIGDSKALAAWNTLTPLARNEWICWVISVKKAETRSEHVERVRAQIKEGKRRPCCWIGCVHRTDKPISPSVQYVLDRHRKSK